MIMWTFLHNLYDSENKRNIIKSLISVPHLQFPLPSPNNRRPFFCVCILSKFLYTIQRNTFLFIGMVILIFSPLNVSWGAFHNNTQRTPPFFIASCYFTGGKLHALTYLLMVFRLFPFLLLLLQCCTKYLEHKCFHQCTNI